jgi:hypothetical protein
MRRLDTGSSAYDRIFHRDIDGGSDPKWGFLLWGGAGADKDKVYWAHGSAYIVADAVSSATDYEDYVATWDGASIRMYRNGFLAAGPTAVAAMGTDAARPVTFGTPTTGGGGAAGAPVAVAWASLGDYLTAGEVAALAADPWAMVRPRSRLIVPLTLSGGAAPSDGTLAVTLGATTLSATGTAAAAPASAATLAVTLGAATLTASGTAGTAGTAAGTLAVTLGATTLTASGTAGTPAGSAGTLAATLGAVTLAAAATAAAAGAAAGTLAVTLGGVTLAASGTAGTAAGSDGSLAVTLGATTLAATGTAAEPGIVAGTLAVTLGAVTLAASGTAGTVDGSAGSLDVTLGAVTLAASGVASAPGTATGSLAVTLGAMTLVASATSPDGVATVDMLDSIANVLDAIADLNTAFGSTGWFWHTLAPPRTPVPYVVWRESSGSVMGESGGASWLTDNTYSVSVYAATRAEARRLCRAAVAAIEAAADAGSIVFTEGALASLQREAGAFDQLDPDPGEDGADVWEHRITLRAFVDDQIIVS